MTGDDLVARARAAESYQQWAAQEWRALVRELADALEAAEGDRDAFRLGADLEAREADRLRVLCGELAEALRALNDARAGTNEHGVFWNTAKLRRADADAETLLARYDERKNTG